MNLVEILIALTLVSVMLMSVQVISQLSLQTGQVLVRQHARFLLSEMIAERQAARRYALKQTTLQALWQQRISARLPLGQLHQSQGHLMLTWGQRIIGERTSCQHAFSPCLGVAIENT
ncbi:hypothetical protein AVI51_09270 [Piscirickettsia salmonis]|uniref:Uncharacterized protein n=1 Tax=Piscirickettsia salmonis TaxID=1238 RepID=A0A9Q5VC96_PISSA|nr:hypothetical protein [Piscirickettsia salmonis]ALA23742.1 Tat pathway signal protein [Piscirickettsia salmonis]APS44176.1 hypothetical protein AVI48_07250 [Piscirickettsia salmonis]APS47536.1 hypothetical protein AVI49_07860 [Piscirickettsia salmonis]APS51030.1 hypothetical protein AVI50_09365 [Piscirickettsia salmonis]APS54236.1 hypothetical protein AVI51_09270 [Piscirickettsia salmonis]